MNNTPSLRDLQLRFADAIFAADQRSFDGAIRPNGIASAERLDIYRNNMLLGLSKALRSAYPVIEKLVGADFFRYAAHEFIHQYPSRSGDLHNFGGQFADFLQAFAATAKLTYLPDVARLEWAYHRVYSAAHHPALDTQALATVPPERYEELHFQLHPASQLVRSEFPLLTIWQVNQLDYQGDQTVDLTAGGATLLVIRRELDITIESLPHEEFSFLYALAQGDTFATACEQALAVNSDSDVAAIFQRHVAQHTLVAFSLDQ